MKQQNSSSRSKANSRQQQEHAATYCESERLKHFVIVFFVITAVDSIKAKTTPNASTKHSLRDQRSPPNTSVAADSKGGQE